jgi:hypothetical protein
MEDSAGGFSTGFVRSTKHLAYISRYIASHQYNDPFNRFESPKLASLALHASVSWLGRISTQSICLAVEDISKQRGVNDFTDWQSWCKALQGPLCAVALLSKLKLCSKVLS